MFKKSLIAGVLTFSVILTGCGKTDETKDTVEVQENEVSKSTSADNQTTNQNEETVRKTQPINTSKTPENKEQLTNKEGWLSYENKGLGISLKYPNDGTFEIENPDKDLFILTQEHPGERFHFRKQDSCDNFAKQDQLGKEVFNSNEYTRFQFTGMGKGYGYYIEKNGYCYTFESNWGPQNEIFYEIMNTIEFK